LPLESIVLANAIGRGATADKSNLCKSLVSSFSGLNDLVVDIVFI
jgi:hypothetical protein